MIAEIRDYGDGKSKVLYTDNTQVAQTIGTSGKAFRIQPYFKWRLGKKIRVGVDLYFPKRHENWIVRKIEQLGFPRPEKT